MHGQREIGAHQCIWVHIEMMLHGIQHTSFMYGEYICGFSTFADLHSNSHLRPLYQTNQLSVQILQTKCSWIADDP